jgi:hypothetical protein
MNANPVPSNDGKRDGAPVKKLSGKLRDKNIYGEGYDISFWLEADAIREISESYGAEGLAVYVALCMVERGYGPELRKGWPDLVPERVPTTLGRLCWLARTGPRVTRRLLNEFHRIGVICWTGYQKERATSDDLEFFRLLQCTGRDFYRPHRNSKRGLK